MLSTTINVIFVNPVVNAQKKYFEYNNPEALKLTSKTLEKLYEKEWFVKKIEYVERERTYYHYSYSSVTYKPDRTYSFGAVNGTWEIAYGKYLRHEEEKRQNWGNGLAGIYAIIFMNDTSLVMTKLLTSSRDMKRTIYFSTKKSFTRQLVKNDTGTVNKVQQIQRHRYYDRAYLTHDELDSLSYFNDADVSENSFSVEGGLMRVNTRDTTYFVALKRSDEAYLKIFSADEALPEFEYTGKRFTPSYEEVVLINKALSEFLAEYVLNFDIRTEVSLKAQFFQYVGFVNTSGKRIIYLTCFCEYNNAWKHRLITRNDKPLCLLTARYDVSANMFLDLQLN